MMNSNDMHTLFLGGRRDGLRIPCGEPITPGLKFEDKETPRGFSVSTPPSSSARSIYGSVGVKGDTLVLVHLP